MAEIKYKIVDLFAGAGGLSNKLQAKLKVCSECLMYIRKLYRDIDYMTQSMSDYKAAMVNYKIAFEPGPVSFKNISDEINIYHKTI